MTSVILVRHAESEANVGKVLSGQTPHVPLTALGHEQAKNLGRDLAPWVGHKPIAIVSSPYVRTHETARHLARALGVPEHAIELDHELRERSFGALEGTANVNFQKVPGFLTKPGGRASEHWRPEGGESLEDVRHRAAPAVDRAVARHRGKQVIVVTHGHVVKALDAHAHGTWDRKSHRAENAAARMVEWPGEVEEEDTDPYSAGGCLAYARALRQRLGRGARLIDVVEPHGDGILMHPGLPHHVVVHFRGKLHDAAGTYSETELLDKWRAGSGKATLRLEPHNPTRARETGLAARARRVDSVALAAHVSSRAQKLAEALLAGERSARSAVEALLVEYDEWYDPGEQAFAVHHLDGEAYVAGNMGSASQIRKELQRQEFHELAGSVAKRHRPREKIAYLSGMELPAHARGQGLGSDMLRTALAGLAQRGTKHVYLHASEPAGPGPLNKFYARHGFEKIGVLDMWPVYHKKLS